ncbi:uncharacterized protein MONOS_6005 [Monocercomonoides exilis]|uniref:uncharacterized protein n=1 Tax=Monocercomonoides exilis TaxID=2049356 RepID=UPI0035599A3F|nr:hypothetical protein MONOS_6005 [Monocercomonoides exilis]|eukprot:MONOS_6005.1-p1 / transcript=MONOS_6005.1 / gene=MONOS_6005 / organism=Monocercomonoides_exilis_PA203 / gene_product=unspecified product / transcript_product=unspecified product / location=Mono_scaffold00183:17081-17449(-) / protein_length=123 / sequence_SO=supercontig / SO=protein_coding / is_pseudo=false
MLIQHPAKMMLLTKNVLAEADWVNEMHPSLEAVCWLYCSELMLVMVQFVSKRERRQVNEGREDTAGGGGSGGDVGDVGRVEDEGCCEGGEVEDAGAVENETGDCCVVEGEGASSEEEEGCCD